MKVSRWERGAHVPSNDNLVALAAIFSVDVSWFYETSEARAA